MMNIANDDLIIREVPEELAESMRKSLYPPQEEIRKALDHVDANITYGNGNTHKCTFVPMDLSVSIRLGPMGVFNQRYSIGIPALDYYEDKSLRNPMLIGEKIKKMSLMDLAISSENPNIYKADELKREAAVVSAHQGIYRMDQDGAWQRINGSVDNRVLIPYINFQNHSSYFDQQIELAKYFTEGTLEHAVMNLIYPGMRHVITGPNKDYVGLMLSTLDVDHDLYHERRLEMNRKEQAAKGKVNSN